MRSFFVSDLHGNIDQYQKLITKIIEEQPKGVFFGGDLLPSGLHSLASSISVQKEFINSVLIKGFTKIKKALKENYPEVFLILGNDDSKFDEKVIKKGEKLGLWKYMNKKTSSYGEYLIYGYSYIPPTPFLMKDFEKYDVSQYVDPGCIPIEEGVFSFKKNRALLKRETIKNDLDNLDKGIDYKKGIMLFHSPPYQTYLDRADLDGRFHNHVPLDVHIGSVAIKRFIQEKQPLISLHGHVHESARLTGSWKDKIGNTSMYTAAHDGDELCVIIFNPECLEQTSRELI